MIDRLKVGGQMYIGFSPLYNSPYGLHHKIINWRIPWAHLLLPDSMVIKGINYNRKKRNLPLVNTIQEIGINKLSLKEYKRILRNPKMLIISFKTNQNKKGARIFLNCLSKIQLLQEYMIYNIYCILQKKMEK
jgi:hypothetical protein